MEPSLGKIEIVPVGFGNASLRAWISGAMTNFDGPINLELLDGSVSQLDWVKIYKRQR